MTRDDLIEAMAAAQWARQYGDESNPSGGGAFRRRQIRSDVAALVPAVVAFVAAWLETLHPDHYEAERWREDLGCDAK